MLSDRLCQNEGVMVNTWSILGNAVTAYEITPNSGTADPNPAERDNELANRIYERLAEESRKLAISIKSGNLEAKAEISGK
jgi:hypothetical protein